MKKSIPNYLKAFEVYKISLKEKIKLNATSFFKLCRQLEKHTSADIINEIKSLLEINQKTIQNQIEKGFHQVSNIKMDCDIRYEALKAAKEAQEDYSTEKSDFKLSAQKLSQEITSSLSKLDFLIQEQNKGILDRIEALHPSEEIKLILDQARTHLGLSSETHEIESHSKSFVEQQQQRNSQEEAKQSHSL